MTEPEASPEPVAPAAALPGGNLAGQAELDASFAAAFAQHDPGGDEPETETGSSSETELEPQAAEERAESDDEQTDGETSKAPDEPREDDEKYEKALLALRYSGMPSKIIKNASRDELIAWGTEAADRRAKTEAALEERATRIRELEEATKAPAAQAKPAAPDWTPHLKALSEELGLTPEGAQKAFGPLLDAVAQQVRSEFEGRLAPMEQTTQEARAAEGRRQISEQVRRLSESHPKLKTDQDLVSKLNGKALVLWKGALDAGSPYASAEECYDDASKLVNLGSTAAIAAKRRNGSAPPPEGRVEDRTENSDDAFLTALDRIEAGDVRGAKRAGSQVRWGREDRRSTPTR